MSPLKLIFKKTASAQMIPFKQQFEKFFWSFQVRHILIIAAGLSFVIGTLFGTQYFKNFSFTKKRGDLRILTYKNILSQELLESIAIEQNLKIEIDTAQDQIEFNEKFRDARNKYDLIIPFLHQAANFDEEARLQVFNWSLLTNKENLSPDFLNTGGTELSRKLLPIAWGVNGILYDSQFISSKPQTWLEIINSLKKTKIRLYDIPPNLFRLSLLRRSKPKRIENDNINYKELVSDLLQFSQLTKLNLEFSNELTMPNFEKIQAFEINRTEALRLLKSEKQDRYIFILPNDGAYFWTLNIAQPRFATHTNEAARFINSFLEVHHAYLFTKNFKQASTNRLLEATDIESYLKASEIRQIPLTNLKYITSFPESEIFTPLIQQSPKDVYIEPFIKK